MKSVTFNIFYIAIVLSMISSSCDFSKKSKENDFYTSNTLDELEVLLTQLNQLDTIGCRNMDEIVSINESMRRIVENIRSAEKFDKLAKAYKTHRPNVKFAASEDGTFGVFSWRTKMDCLGNQIKNIALYKTDNGVLSSSLYGKPMIYHRVSSNPMKKGNYLLHANNTIKGYSISNGYLEETPIDLKDASFADNQPFEDD
ncbi:hypothetical protein [Flagellimonas sp.]|uniref:hypothetical protein n=1 Tax=Flagellimonas sp. TaxID=2058762 RepID=UPI003BAD3EBA